MAGYSDYTEKLLQDKWLGGANFTPAATIYVGLSATTVNDDGTGITEPSGGAYARVAVTNNLTNWPAASGATALKQNAIAIVFPVATADWGTVTYFFFSDASTSGNMLASAPLTLSKIVQEGDTASFGISSISSTLD